MPPTFAPPQPRNFFVPALIVLLVVAIAFASIWFFTPHHVVDASITRVSTLPIQTSYTAASPSSYANGTRIVGKQEQKTEDDIYVLVTLRLHDDLRLPLFIKDFTATLAPRDGDDITAGAIEKTDLASVYAAYPSLHAMSGPPLYRETEIAPGGTAEGMVMLQYQVPESVWKQRKSASLTVDFYHQDPITIPLPQ